MDYEEWEPIYEEIIKDFGYSKEKDLESAVLLGELRGSDGLEVLKIISGSTVEVLGPLAERSDEKITMIAGASISKLEDIDVETSFLVTDLDGNTGYQLKKNVEGMPALIHAHGDNIDLIKKWSPKFTGQVISTCQCRPPEGVYNFGGFTDGDRCVFLADHFDAKKIVLNGWDFENPASKIRNKKMKKKKLVWAQKLIDMVDTPIYFK
ncbi:MAG: 6-hydroxymethylpterin diphosphokinase MptE-like protein [Candidatus Saliniplasma sp.]